MERFYCIQLWLQPALRAARLVHLRVLLREIQRTPQRNYLWRQGFRFTRSQSIALDSPNPPPSAPPQAPASAATDNIYPPAPCHRQVGFPPPPAVKGPWGHLPGSTCTHAAFWQLSIPLGCPPPPPPPQFTERFTSLPGRARSWGGSSKGGLGNLLTTEGVGAWMLGAAACPARRSRSRSVSAAATMAAQRRVLVGSLLPKPAAF